MTDVVVKRFEDLESYQGEGRFLYAGKGLGVSAWGMNLMRLPAHWQNYPNHDHAKDGQEEAYVVIEGSARLEADGKTWDLVPGTLVRVGPNQKRKIVPGERGAVILALGGTPGKAYPTRS